MNIKSVSSAFASASFCVALVFLSVQSEAQNIRLRVMAANTTSGNQQSYEAPGVRIFQGLRPDIVAIQEFQVGGISDSNTLRTLVNTAFGTNFNFYCEPNNGIPNGVVSRYPILDAGFWTDVQVGDRGFVWAQIDLPGTNDLYVVSVHLHSSGGSSSRAIEATNLKALIQAANWPSNAWIIVGGDFNTDSRSESCMNTFKTYLSDSPIPSDEVSNAAEEDNTNAGRNKPYDYVLPSFSMTNLLTSVVISNRTFPSGLVFDSRVYPVLAEVAPVQLGDSGVANMQHMAVVKDFLIPTNSAPVNTPPSIAIQPQSQTNTVGSMVSFTVTANGSAPLAYQWRFFGTNLASASADAYSITNIQTANAGDYSVVITNAFGSITSSIATLTVNSSPVITTNPQNQTVTVGGNATFTVAANGSAPLSYQWRFNSADISGATNTSYTRTNSQLVDAGNYAVVVTNSVGSVTSAVAVLTVNTISSATNVVISQIYGGGANSGATYRSDFVELFNPNSGAVSLAGWSVQYASSTGTSWQAGNLTGSIQPYKYYLVQMATGATGNVIPIADATNTINMSASQGKVALVSSQTVLSGSNPVGAANVVDFVGFGSANAFEGIAAAPSAPSGNNTTSTVRKTGGFTDSNNNTNDFITISPPTPRNSASPANPPSATPAITPTLTNAILSGNQFQFQLTGTAGSNYIVQATTNLSPVNWISVRTNTAPFTFVESNVFALPQRFYRGMIAP